LVVGWLVGAAPSPETAHSHGRQKTKANEHGEMVPLRKRFLRRTFFAARFLRRERRVA
jgi:hypothetical protein